MNYSPSAAPAVFTVPELIVQLQDVNQKLEMAELFKSRFLSNVRNEVFNPIASILGIASRLRNVDEITPENLRTLASLVYADAFYLDYQFKNLVTAAEMESGIPYMELSNAELSRVALQVAEMFTFQAQMKDIRLVVTTASAPFITDAYRLKIALANLVANAIEYSHNNTEVHITLSFPAPDVADFAVRDFGVGIPPERLPGIFDRFYQLDSSTRKGHRGHGLGLSVAQAVANVLGGSIDVRSEQGLGSTFTMRVRSQPTVQIETASSTDGDDIFF